MASNSDLILKKYGDGTTEEGRATSGQTDYRMQFIYTERLLERFVPAGASVAEVGCGTGHYGGFLAERCASYHGVDLSPGNIALFREKIEANGWTNVRADIADATDLSLWEDQSFDVVLVFGPMYHLPPEEREIVFRESRRICREGGLVLVYYINKIGAYLRGCLGNPGGDYPNRAVNDIVLRQGTDDVQTGVFFYTMPEEMDAAARRNGLRPIESAGVDFSLYHIDMRGMEEEKREAWMELFDIMHKSPSCTGFSNHAVMVCARE